MRHFGAEVPLRHIFIAALCTLCAITALLALPPIGEQQSMLVAQTVGDRLSVASEPPSEPAPRMLVSPTASPAVSDSGIQVLGSVELPSAESGDDAEPLRPVTQLAAPVLDESGSEDPATSEVSETSAASSTTTTSTTTTTAATTTTTTAPTTTTPPTTATPDSATVDDSGGVIISATNVVLPIIGPAAGAGWRAMTPCGNEVTMTTGERVISVDFVLDPGHGGNETGSSGPNGAIEKALNLRIAEIVEWYLEEAGYSVLLTRSTDIRMPLKSRAEIANALDPLAFISIHHNGGATRPQSRPGTELFVDGGNPEAKRLGGILFEQITERLSAYDANWVGSWRNGVSARLNSEGADLYGIHRYTPGIVSVITEAGYLSNASEAELFVDNDVQWSHGRAIAEGLMRWHRTSDPGSGYLNDFVDDSSSGTGGFSGCVDPSI